MRRLPLGARGWYIGYAHLVDKEGAWWPGVSYVMQHTKADEVETEIRA